MKVFEIRDSFSIDNLVSAERPEPSPGNGQAVVKVRAVSLNYRDLLIVKGLYNPKIPLPLVPFSDGAGDVVAVGEGVSRVKAGDRVAGIFMQTWLAGEVTEARAKSALGGGTSGMLAEYVLLHEDGLVHVPEHLTYEEAATLPCAARHGVACHNRKRSEAGRECASPRHRRGLFVCPAVCADGRSTCDHNIPK